MRAKAKRITTMRKYQVIYRGNSRTIEASAPHVARTFATHWLRLDDVVPPDEDFDPAEIAVIDPDEAGYGRHMGHCQGCSPNEMCSRSGTCEWCDDRFDSAYGVERDRHEELARSQRIYEAREPGAAWAVAAESTWSRIKQDDLDTVHNLWCRRAGDVK